MLVNAWLVFALAGVGTYLLRASLILAVGDRDLPSIVARAVRYVAPAVMAALAVRGIFLDDGVFDPIDLRVVAAVVAGLVAWRWASLLATLAAGLASYVALDLLLTALGTSG